MKKIISAVIAIVLVLSLSLSVMADGVAPATGDSNIKCEISDVTVKVRTLTVKYSNANFDADDDVTFLFYAPESAESDNIIDTNIYHADQVEYSADGYTFTLSNDVPAGTYNLLIGGTDEDVPCLVKGITLARPYEYGDVDYSGGVDSLDILKIAKYIVGFEAEMAEIDGDSAKKALADVTWDGNVDSLDTLKIAKYVVGFEGVDLSVAGN